MKTNTLILITTLSAVLLTSLMSCSMWRKQALQKQFLTQELTSKLAYTDIGLNLTGQSLVLYHVSHSDYPHFITRRLQIANNSNYFNFDARGVHGNITQHVQQKAPYEFKRQLITYNPNEHLLNLPMVTLSILGYDTLDTDIKLTASLVAPNQITCDLFFIQQGKPKAHFVAKFKPQNPKASIFENMMHQNIYMKVAYLDDDFKRRLDDYCLSKQLPFITDNQEIPFSLLQK